MALNGIKLSDFLVDRNNKEFKKKLLNYSMENRGEINLVIKHYCN